MTTSRTLTLTASTLALLTLAACGGQPPGNGYGNLADGSGPIAQDLAGEDMNNVGPDEDEYVPLDARESEDTDGTTADILDDDDDADDRD